MFKKIGIVLLALALAGCGTKTETATTTTTNAPTGGSEEFQTLLDEEFVTYLESDFLNYHYTVKDGASFDVTKPEVTLGELNLESFEKASKASEESLAKLNAIDVKTLSGEESRQYEILKQMYEEDIIVNSYPMYVNLFAPSSGIANDLIVAMEEYKFYSATDVDDYLVVMDDFDRYLRDAIEFTKVQIDAGFFMNDFTVDKTVEGLDKFMSRVDDNQFIISFDERIDLLGVENSAELKKQNKEIVLNQVLPVFQEVKDFLLANKGLKADDVTLASTKEGKEYYEFTVQQKVGTDLSVDELFVRGQEYIANMIKKVSILYADQELINRVENLTIDLETPEEMLAFLQSNLDKAYPQGPEVTYQVSYLNPTVADENVVAYYLIPPLDAPKENIIRINGAAVNDEIDLYTTLAHEGFPGHLYQTTYYFNEDVHPLFKALAVLGYTEGWAMVTELEALEWISDEKAAAILGADIEYGYILQSVLDIGVNYKGWGTKEIKSLLMVEDEEVLQDIYETVASEPTQIVSYGFGLMLFKDLEANAKAKLGDKFDKIEYNKVILDGGSRAFKFVEEDVNAYIKENQ